MNDILRTLWISVRYTMVSVIALGLLYPFAMTLLAHLFFPFQADGSMISAHEKTVGSAIIGQLWSAPRYFHGRLSAAGKGYDPTATGGTNLGPSSKKLLDATAASVKTVIAENPDATGPVPPDLTTSSASGIDPDVSPEGAYFQVPRIAKTRGLSQNAVRALVDAHIRGRDLGFLGEPRVNVLELNLALDALHE
jgi:potassium-transporting ATPase KdpC subunit